MELFFYFFIFLFGLISGSFLNSIVYRLQAKESFLFKRSYCPHCKQKLSWQDLIPLLSFLILFGKCRYCKKQISWQYPLVELATGILFLLIFFYFPIFDQFFNFSISNFLYFLYLLIITCFLIIIFVFDLNYFIIPDKIIYPAIFVTSFYRFFEVWNFGILDLSKIKNLGFGILPSLFFLGIILFSRGRLMGFGDFKLAILMGLILGFPNILVALFLAFFIGAIIGIGLIIFKKKNLKSKVPFGPFLVTGTFGALFWAKIIINWYLNLLNL